MVPSGHSDPGCTALQSEAFKTYSNGDGAGNGRGSVQNARPCSQKHLLLTATGMEKAIAYAKGKCSECTDSQPEAFKTHSNGMGEAVDIDNGKCSECTALQPEAFKTHSNGDGGGSGSR